MSHSTQCGDKVRRDRREGRKCNPSTHSVVGSKRVVTLFDSLNKYVRSITLST